MSLQENPPHKFKAGDKVENLNGTIMQIKDHSGTRKQGNAPFVNVYTCLKLTKRGKVDERSSKKNWLTMRFPENELKLISNDTTGTK